MAEECKGGEGKEANVELPGGIKVQTKGYHLGNLLQIIAAVLLAVMALMMYELRIETKNAAIAITAVASGNAIDKQDHDKINRSIEKVVEAQDVATYVLTLKQEEREQLNLRMPESLRRRHDR